MRFSKLIVALLIASILPAANAVSLGNIESTYPIGKESALDMIMKKLRKKEHGDELKRLQGEAVRCSMGSIKNVKPVDDITTVHARAQHFIDPTVTYTKPVTTDDGRIVVPAGTKINPPDMTSLTKTLVLFDNRGLEQREAVGRLVTEGDQLKVKPILITGSWLGLIKAWEIQVFYDQEGTPSKRFGVMAVPAVVRQQGKMLVLDEIPMKELQ